MFGQSRQNSGKICQFYLNGNCKYGSKCWNIHSGQSGGSGMGAFSNVFGKTSAAESGAKMGNSPLVDKNFKEFMTQVATEMNMWETNSMWQLSSLAPLKDHPLITGFTDTSPEELRVEAYLAQKTNAFPSYETNVKTKIDFHRQLRQALKSQTSEAVDALKNVYYSSNSKENKGQAAAGSAFGGSTGQTSAFGGLSSNQNSSVFGGGSSAFGGFSKNAFGDSSSTGVFGGTGSSRGQIFGGAGAANQNKSVFGSSIAAGQTPSNSSAFNAVSSSSNVFGSSTSGSGAFGAQASGAFGTSTSSAFGTSNSSAFGAPASGAFGTSTSSAFGAPAASAFGAVGSSAFGAKTPSAFGATQTPSAFGATQTPSAFGATQTPSAFGATQTPSAFGATQTPSAFGATQSSTFGKSESSAFGATSAFGTGTSSGIGTGGSSIFGASSGGTLGTGNSSFGTLAANSSSVFGGNPPNVFGASAVSNPLATKPPTTNVLGSTGSSAFGVFGAQQTPNAFGGSNQAAATGSVFGKSDSSQPNIFGASQTGSSAFSGVQNQASGAFTSKFAAQPTNAGSGMVSNIFDKANNSTTSNQAPNIFGSGPASTPFGIGTGAASSTLSQAFSTGASASPFVPPSSSTTLQATQSTEVPLTESSGSNTPTLTLPYPHIYTPLHLLTLEDKTEFERDHFVKIPIVPPPRELCV